MSWWQIPAVALWGTLVVAFLGGSWVAPFLLPWPQTGSPSTWDQNAAVYACAPAEAVMEEVCGTWLKHLLGLPLEASFALVSGCQMAHVTCLAAARHALLKT